MKLDFSAVIWLFFIFGNEKDPLLSHDIPL